MRWDGGPRTLHLGGVSDDAVTSTVRAALDARGLLPATHVADTGFVSAALCVEAQPAA